MTQQLDANIVALAASLKDKMTVGDQGIVTLSEGAYEQTLPEGLTIDMVKSVQQHNADVVSAAGLALGELGLNAFKSDKALQQVSVEVPVLKDSISGTFARSKQVPDGNGGMATKHGALSMRYSVSGASGSKGALKKVRTHLMEQAKEVLEG